MFVHCVENQNMKNPVRELYYLDKTKQFKGLDNKQVPKIVFLRKIVRLDINRLSSLTQKIIIRWIKKGRKRDDYFWKMNACFFEFLRRNKQQVFFQIYRKIYRK